MVLTLHWTKYVVWNFPLPLWDYKISSIPLMPGIERRLLNDAAQKWRLFSEEAPGPDFMITAMTAISSSLTLPSDLLFPFIFNLFKVFSEFSTCLLYLHHLQASVSPSPPRISTVYQIQICVSFVIIGFIIITLLFWKINKYVNTTCWPQLVLLIFIYVWLTICDWIICLWLIHEEYWFSLSTH